jgi:hypothetical protein
MFGIVIFRESDWDGFGRWVTAARFPFQARGPSTYRVLKSWPESEEMR